MTSTIGQLNPPRLVAMDLLNQGINPSLFNWSAINTNTENHTNVFQAPVSFKMSCHVKTPVNNNNASAIKAVKVASI